MINNNEFAWEDIKIIMPGSTQPVNALEIEYTEEKDHKEIYGRGNKPVSLGSGNIKYSGKVVLLQSEVEAMIVSLPAGKSLTQLPAFTVTVGYAPEGGVAVVDNLLYCRVKKFTKNMKQGDANMEVTLDLSIADIKYNV